MATDIESVELEAAVDLLEGEAAEVPSSYVKSAWKVCDALRQQCATIKRLQARIAVLEKSQGSSFLDEALNSGNGTYRP